MLFKIIYSLLKKTENNNKDTGGKIPKKFNRRASPSSYSRWKSIEFPNQNKLLTNQIIDPINNTMPALFLFIILYLWLM